MTKQLTVAFQLEDNLDLIQTFPVGIEVPMTINLKVRHIGPAVRSLVGS